MNRKNLAGISREDLTAELASIGEKAFRAKQLWHWIYYQGKTDFVQMTTLSKSLQTRLAEKYEIRRPNVSQVQRSKDRTQKWLVRFEDNQEAETVYIPEDGRGAICISSQVGCTLTCTFCRTGTQKLVRNLTSSEIVGQFLLARDFYGEWPTPSDEGRMISNVVMMGMGEPLLNYDNVVKALKIIMDNEGIALSKRRITLSTSGIVPMMHRCGEDLGVNLAVSLHAVRDDLRDILVPINRRYPIADLLAACRSYPAASNARRITFEYVMLKGVNDSLADARELIQLLKGIPAKLNLIPFNGWSGAPYECSSNNQMRRFAKILNEGGFSAPIRVPRGRDILAACGQLRSSSKRS